MEAKNDMAYCIFRYSNLYISKWLQAARETRKIYQDHYFLADPDKFIFEFFPMAAEHQFLEHPITKYAHSTLYKIKSLGTQSGFPSTSLHFKLDFQTCFNKPMFLLQTVRLLEMRSISEKKTMYP